MKFSFNFIILLSLFAGTFCYAQSNTCQEDLAQIKAVIQKDGSLLHYGSGCSLVESFAGSPVLRGNQCHETGYYNASFDGGLHYYLSWQPGKWKNTVVCVLIK